MPSNIERFGYVSADRNGRSMPWRADLGPGDLEEAHETRVVDGGDRRLAVLGRLDEREPAVGDQRVADPLGPLGDLVRGDRTAP